MKVRRRVNASGGESWQADFGVVNGRRLQRSFKTKIEAEQALAAGRKHRDRMGSLGFQLSVAEVSEFVTARERLGGVPIITAVEFYLANAVRIREQLSLATAIERYLDSKSPDQLAKDSRVNIVVSLGSFAAFVGPRLCHEVTTEDITRWLNGNGWKPKTRNNYLGDVRSFFAWAKGKHVERNPTDDIERAKIGDRIIEVLSVDECRALLAAAWNMRGRKLLGFVTLGLFCGIRPDEICRLKWAKVNLEERTVIIDGPLAKTRKRRVVDISTNAVAWLRGCDRVGDVVPSYLHDAWRTLRDECGWSASGRSPTPSEAKKGKRPWPHDAMRHTFASMHYAAHQDERWLQVQMGHESDEMLHRHYRALVTKEEARRFWEVKPGRSDK